MFIYINDSIHNTKKYFDVTRMTKSNLGLKVGQTKVRFLRIPRRERLLADRHGHLVQEAASQAPGERDNANFQSSSQWLPPVLSYSNPGCIKDTP